MRKVFVFALVLAVGLAGAPATAIAASNSVASAPAQDPGKIVGVLKDAAGKPLQNVTVNVLDKAGNIVSSVATDANGLFSVGNLPAGSYSIQAVNAGQALAGLSSVTVTAGATTTIAATATATGVAVAAGSAGFISALGGPIAAAALASAGVVGAVAIQQALKDASPSK